MRPIKGTIGYLRADRTDRQASLKTQENRECEVRDGRAESKTLARNAFELVRWRSSVAHRLSRPALKEPKLMKAYQADVANFVRGLIGAKYAVSIQSLTRTADRSDYMTAYSKFAHTDVGDSFLAPQPKDGPPVVVTAKNLMRFFKAAMKVQTGATASQAEIEKGLEYALINVWQPMRNVAVRQPLVMLDYESIADGDRVSLSSLSSRKIPDNVRGSAAAQTMPVVEISQIKYNPAHRWYYFSDVTPEEALVFTQIEGRAGRARYCLHSSVANPHAPAGAPERESVETRVLCAFPKPAGAGL